MQLRFKAWVDELGSYAFLFLCHTGQIRGVKKEKEATKKKEGLPR